jgi:hypothetical protein
VSGSAASTFRNVAALCSIFAFSNRAMRRSSAGAGRQ